MVEQPLVRPSWSRVAAVAAAGDLVHDVAGALHRIEAAEREVAGRAGRRRRHLVGDGLHQRQEHGFGDALRHFRRAARDGPRIARIEERALRPLDQQRLEGAGVERRIGEDVAHGEIDGRIGGRHHRVHRPAAGRRGAGEIEAQRLARLGDRQRDLQRLVDHAVGIDERLGAIHAVGNRGDVGAHQLRRAAADLGDRLRSPCRGRSDRSARSAAARPPSAPPPGP